MSCLRRLWLLLRRVRYKRSKIFNDSSVSRANTLLRGVCKALKRSIAVHSDVPPLLPQQRTTKPYRLPKESVGGITQYVAFLFCLSKCIFSYQPAKICAISKILPEHGSGWGIQKGSEIYPLTTLPDGLKMATLGASILAWCSMVVCYISI